MARFANNQDTTGWLHLEITTWEGATDRNQAKAAGIAEGYLTRAFILEKYKEFYTNDFCAKDPAECAWIFKRFDESSEWAKSQAEEKGDVSPQWHQIDLLYRQMEGIYDGKRQTLVAVH